ncbi:SDR family oxidoreductase [Micromonospora sp. NPDC049275]|uniref:SDR family oxidoreductase n=1 Tax=unclassified Micromonospora TaxID=2617518 RepID=UPI00371F6E00
MEHEVRVNMLVPTAIVTQMTPDQAAGHRCLLGRCGEPEEVADTIMFLLSPKASYTTGSTLQVHGGLGLR